MRLLLLLLISVAAGATAWAAGPPFQLDDPDVIPYRHFEFYTFSNLGSTPGVTNTTGPALELNWSGIPNVMFHFLVPAAEAFPSGGPDTFGLGDSEVGLQLRAIPETKHRPMVGTFPMMEIPTGNPARGLGAGKPSWKIPIWMQKSIGPWTVDWGGGENVSHIVNARDYPFGGVFLQRDVSKKLSLAGEVYYHGRETTDEFSSRYATMVDIGGYYTIHHPGFQLLFCYGHSVAGQTEDYAYLGLYWTWGPPDTSTPRASKVSRLLRKL
jgi:hypothetical protein